MNECETMGREINLKKRVVQVWFQNARAKEKKGQGQNIKSILFSNSANNDLSNYECSPDECLLCGVKYNSPTGPSAPGANSQQQRDHLFSKEHLHKLIQFVSNIANTSGSADSSSSVNENGNGTASGKRRRNTSYLNEEGYDDDDDEEEEMTDYNDEFNENGDDEEIADEFHEEEDEGNDTEGNRSSNQQDNGCEDSNPAEDVEQENGFSQKQTTGSLNNNSFQFDLNTLFAAANAAATASKLQLAAAAKNKIN